MRQEPCAECGKPGKWRGWTNAMYCSEQCERQGVGRVHGTMPGVMDRNWMPSHVSREISRRWEEN